MTAGHSRNTSPTSISALWKIEREILWTRKKPAVCRWYSCSIEERQRLLLKSPHIKRQHDGCMQSCRGIPNVWVGVVSWMALIVLMVDGPKRSNWGFRRTWIEVAFDLPKKSTSWKRIWVSPRYGFAIQFFVVFKELYFSDCWFNSSWPVVHLSSSVPATMQW